MTIQEFEATLAGAIRGGQIPACAAAAWRTSFRRNPRHSAENLTSVAAAKPQKTSERSVDWRAVGEAVARANAILGQTDELRPYPATLFPELARTRRPRATGSVEGTGVASPPRAAAPVSSTEPDPTQVAQWAAALFPDTRRTPGQSRVTSAAD